MAKQRKIKTRSKFQVTRSKTRAHNLGTLEGAKRSIALKLKEVNRILGRFEGEVEGLVKKLVRQGEKSRRELRRNFDEIISRIGAGEIFAFANETRGELEKEVRHLAEEVVEAFKEVESLINHQKFAGLLEDARRGFGNLVELLAENDLVSQAKQTLLNTRTEVLGFLRIPTQTEVEKLERKIVSLEKRLTHLSRKAA